MPQPGHRSSPTNLGCLLDLRTRRRATAIATVTAAPAVVTNGKKVRLKCIERRSGPPKDGTEKGAVEATSVCQVCPCRGPAALCSW